MAPPNDLIANAEVIGKGWQTVTGTTDAATFSDEGAAGYDQPSVWYRLDTTLYQQVPVWIKVTPATGYHIYGELYSVNDPSPSAEDLLLGNVGSFCDSFGDGTDGVTSYLLDVDSLSVGDGLYYFLYVGNYDFDSSTGDFTFEIGVPWSVRAIDDPNTASSTVTVMADAIKDVQYNEDGFPEYHNLMPTDGTDSFYARGSALATSGKWYVGFRARRGGTTNNDGQGLGIARNGYCYPIARWEDGLAASPTVTSFYPHETGGSYLGLSRRPMHPLWLSTSDEIAFRIFTDSQDAPGATMTEWMEVLDVTFYPPWLTWPFNEGATLVSDYTTAPPSTPSAWTLPQLNLGATTELFSMSQVDYGNPSADLAEVGGKDFVVMENGDIYAAWVEENSISPPPAQTSSFIMRYWNGSSWTLISDDVWQRGNSITTHQSWCVSMDVDADGLIYIAWHEREIAANDSYWRCMSYDPGTDTFTEIGSATGQSQFPLAEDARFAASTTQQLRIRISPAGVPWVCWVELPTHAYEELDDFSGGAGNLSGGSPWSTLGGGNPAATDGAGNAYSSVAGAEGASYRTDAATGTPVRPTAVNEISAVSTTNGDYIEQFIHLGDPSLGTFDGYRCRWTRAATNDTVAIHRIDNGAATLLASGTLTGHMAVGDILIFKRSGSGLTAKIIIAANQPEVASVEATTGATSTYTGNGGVVGFGVFGQSYKVTSFSGGDVYPNTGNANYPFCWYWDGGNWIDTALPTAPSPTTTWANVSVSSGSFVRVDLTFCQADGPNENPSVAFNVQWGVTPGTTDAMQWIYWEWSGAAWVNGIQKRANLIWTNGLLSPSQNDGHYHYGMSLVNDGSKPILVAALGFASSGKDYISATTVESDASNWLALNDPFVSKPIAIYEISGGYITPAAEAAAIGTKIYVQNLHPFWTAQHVLGQGESGDDTGWYVISRPNAMSWQENFSVFSPGRIRARNGFIYGMYVAQSDPSGEAMLGIWMYTPSGGFVSMNWRSSDRRGAANRVLVANR